MSTDPKFILDNFISFQNGYIEGRTNTKETANHFVLQAQRELLLTTPNEFNGNY